MHPQDACGTELRPRCWTHIHHLGIFMSKYSTPFKLSDQVHLRDGQLLLTRESPHDYWHEDSIVSLTPFYGPGIRPISMITGSLVACSVLTTNVCGTPACLNRKVNSEYPLSFTTLSCSTTLFFVVTVKRCWSPGVPVALTTAGSKAMDDLFDGLRESMSSPSEPLTSMTMIAGRIVIAAIPCNI